MLEKCYEYFACNKTECIARTLSSPCWEIEASQCEVNADFIKSLQKGTGSKINACKLCSYYKEW